MTYKYILALLLISSSLIAQNKQDYVWLFGQDGVQSGGFFGFKFDYNNPPVNVQVQDINYGLGQANASICDKEGNLLFYMNGCAVLNQEYQMMTNGDSLGYNVFWEIFNENCFGGIGSFQDHLILPDPADNDEYYIIHKPSLFNGNNEIDSLPMWYTKVDMTLDGGLGAVTQKNMKLDDSARFLKSYLTAINHENGKDWWIIQAPTEDSTFHTYLIDEFGIRLTEIQNSHILFTKSKTSASGTAKFSPDGTQYAMYNEFDGLLIYDFDRGSGNLSLKNQISVYDTSGIGIFCSVEWSPNGRFLYTATQTHLHQIDTWENDIQQSGIRLIDTYNGTLDPFPTHFFLMAQAPDCKIYISPTNGSYSFHVIHKPNELGTSCDFEQNGVELPFPSNGGGMPNFPRFRVDEEEKCDPTLTSVFGDEVYYKRDLSVYPIPSDGRYTVDIPTEFRESVLNVFNMEGQIIENIDISSGTLRVDLNITLNPSGVYYVELYPNANRDRIFWSRKVVKSD